MIRMTSQDANGYTCAADGSVWSYPVLESRQISLPPAETLISTHVSSGQLAFFFFQVRSFIFSVFLVSAAQHPRYLCIGSLIAGLENKLGIGVRNPNLLQQAGLRTLLAEWKGRLHRWRKRRAVKASRKEFRFFETRVALAEMETSPVDRPNNREVNFHCRFGTPSELFDPPTLGADWGQDSRPAPFSSLSGGDVPSRVVASTRFRKEPVLGPLFFISEVLVFSMPVGDGKMARNSCNHEAVCYHHCRKTRDGGRKHVST
ncbi:predicted protein [Chaetomium globosum CBS 148.51]|uniref:Uncharacterized protein n=1 Tax=Chaetomium globosum (strain ATCC 6205 / CBS 148.51 / DSM 1962 / NBRC 6347 / NRRL 1970) TaxID=306901 RepID=Q2HGE8_CHAGB|nr:uncharacterized protein CHGG_00706 [Chaetomium globosum CBS 148.51]EAQ92471.1 predicted protein [Chaetomium globosum CBS 148.51]